MVTGRVQLRHAGRGRDRGLDRNTAVTVERIGLLLPRLRSFGFLLMHAETSVVEGRVNDLVWVVGCGLMSLMSALT